MISIVTNENLVYPNLVDCFNPSASFPEYKYGVLSVTANEIYSAVRLLLQCMKLDAENFGKPAWNPLSKFIKPGDKVFLLCNFVNHKGKRESDLDFYSKVTHPSVIRALADYCMIALKGKGEVLIGNSALQSADFEKIKTSLGLDLIEDFYKKNERDVKVEIVDLRGYITKLSSSGKLTLVKDVIGEVGLNIDFTKESLMNYASGNKKYRVTNYSYKLINKLHSENKHIYCLNKKILESDVIISVPKLKVHEKVGVTLGVKGCVGAVASKESLCHHQFGSPCIGGDEYPDCNPLKFLYSLMHDFAYSFNIPVLTPIAQILDRNLTRFFNRVGNKITAGAWHGNNTCWRMAVDLAKILHYCDKNGKMTKQKSRNNLVLIDGVVGGEGQGPLKPTAVNTNTLIFSDNIVEGDYAGVLVMGHDPAKFKIVSDFLVGSSRNSIISSMPESAIYNSENISIDHLKNIFKYKYKYPVGWTYFLG